MKIDFKQPKYVLPLIALPFICLFYIIISGWGGKSKATVAQVSVDSVKTDQINPDMPDVSKDVANSDIKDKFDALKETYKYDKDYSALNSIAGKEATKTSSDIGSVYTEQDIEKLQADQSLDSLKKTIENNKQLLNRGMSRTLSASKYSEGLTEGSQTNSYQSSSQNAQNVMEELRKLQQQRQQQASTYENQNPAQNAQSDRSIPLAHYFAFTPPGHDTYAHKTWEQQPRGGGKGHRGWHVHRPRENSTQWWQCFAGHYQVVAVSACDWWEREVQTAADECTGGDVK